MNPESRLSEISLDPPRLSMQERILLGYVHLDPAEEQGLACVQTHKFVMRKIIERLENTPEGDSYDG